ncbi:MAG: tetratricopeptide repeat protein, partial [Gemmatimonadaceae bacterium]
LGLHRPGEAMVVLEDATRRDPASSELRATYIEALSEARGPAAVIADLERTGASDPLKSVRPLILARAWSALGRRDSALAAYRAGVADAPADAALRFIYASVLLDAGQPANASRELAAAGRAGRLQVARQALLAARIALALGDSAAARTAIVSARAAAPADTTIAQLARTIGAHP